MFGICSLRWAKRRHPLKTGSWVARRYWYPKVSWKWIFSTKKNRLKLFSDTKIVGNIGLKLDKNPYLDSEYFELSKLRPKAMKLTGWYKTRWDMLKDELCA